MRRRGWASILLLAMGPLLLPVPADAASPAEPGPDRERALQCLTLAIAYEAGSEPAAGQQAVAEVILNRTRHPAYPKSVCGVVFQGPLRSGNGCQFTFTCDGAMQRLLPERIMTAAHEVASRVLNGDVAPQVGGATHYHANYVSPYWAPSLIRIGKIGAHIFYRAPGSPDVPARYAGVTEPEVRALQAGLGASGRTAQAPAQAAANPQSPAPVFAPWGLALGASGAER